MIDENKKRLLAEISELGEKLQPDGGWSVGQLHINGYRLECTCPACPEQYEVFDAAGQQVGYLRLRHGWFRADFPDHGGETVYEAYPEGDGIFADHERAGYLSAAVAALAARAAASEPKE